VSVLLPVRDAGGTLDVALASLQIQSFSDFEILAVDDGSTDDTPLRLVEAARRDARLRVLTCPARGIVAALNEGLAVCRAPLVARMDADDVSHRRRFEEQVALLHARPEIDVAGCRVRHFRRRAEGPVSAGMRRYEAWMNSLVAPEDIRAGLFLESPLAHASAVLRRARLLAVGGWHAGDFAEDHDLWLRLDAAGAWFGKVPGVRYLIRDRANRLTRVDPRLRAEAVRALKMRHLAGWIARWGGPAVVVWGVGASGREVCTRLVAMGSAARFEEVRPPPAGTGRAPPTPARGELVVLCYGAAGPRETMRRWLLQCGLVELRDFVCVA
jgi:glycosyltransferase involved in cell wall biosynthesis